MVSFTNPLKLRCAAPSGARMQKFTQKRLELQGVRIGVSLRLLLVDEAVDAHGCLPASVLSTTHVVRYHSATTTMQELVGLVREALRQNNAPFLSIGLAQRAVDPATSAWRWASDLAVDLTSLAGAIDQLQPALGVLSAALSKTGKGTAHIELLAPGLAAANKGLIPALEKMFGIDFRASTDAAQSLHSGRWKMGTDKNYNAARDYVDAKMLQAKVAALGPNPTHTDDAPPATAATAATTTRGGDDGALELGEDDDDDDEEEGQPRLSGAYFMAKAGN